MTTKENLERIDTLFDEIRQNGEECDRLRDEFQKMGFFGVVFKGQKNLNRRKVLLRHNNLLLAEAERLHRQL